MPGLGAAVAQEAVDGFARTGEHLTRVMLQLSQQKPQSAHPCSVASRYRGSPVSAMWISLCFHLAPFVTLMIIFVLAAYY